MVSNWWLYDTHLKSALYLASIKIVVYFASLFVLRVCVRAWVRAFVGACMCERVPGLNVNSLLLRAKRVCSNRTYSPEMEKTSASSLQCGSCSDPLVGDIKGCRYVLSGSLGRVIQVPHPPVNTADNFEYHGPAW